MDNQAQAPVQSNFKFLKYLAIGFAMVSFITAIGVGGYILGTKQSKTLQDIFPSPGESGNKPLPSTLPETENWKTYNFSYFSIKLPQSWRVYSEDNPVQLLNYNMSSVVGGEFNPALDKGKLKIEVYRTEIGDNIRRYLDGVKAERYQKGLGDKTWIESQVTIDGLPAIKVKTSNPGFVVYTQASNSEKIISISFTLDFDNYSDLANQILSTFRFTNP